MKTNVKGKNFANEEGPLELMQRGVTDVDASDRMMSGYEINLTVDKKTGCWNWMGESTIHGYPSHWDDRAGTNRLVSHILYSVLVDWNSEDAFPSSLDEGDDLMEFDEDEMPPLRCGNKLCVNPAHLKTGKWTRMKAKRREKVERKLRFKETTKGRAA